MSEAEGGSIAPVSDADDRIGPGAITVDDEAATAGGLPSPELPFADAFSGERVLEVVALFEDAIVETRHFRPPSRRNLRRRALALLAAAAVASGAALVLLVLAFAKVRVLSLTVDITFFALLVAGFAIFTWGMIRRFESRAPRDFTIGPARDALLAAPGDALPVTCFPLVRADGDGHELTFTAQMAGEVTRDGRTLALADLSDAHPARTVEGARAIALTDGTEARITLGALTFIVRFTPAAQRAPASAAPDPALVTSQAGAFALFMIALTIITALPPPLQLSFDQLRYGPHVIVDGMPCVGDHCGGNGNGGSDGRAHANPLGRMGPRRASHPRPNVYALRGPQDNPDIHLARTLAEEQAANAGVLGILNSRGSLASPFGRDSALGGDAMNVLGGLVGTQTGEAYGSGGLGLVGIGEGGGGIGEGTIGLGDIGTIGRGGGSATGAGYGRGSGGLLGRRADGPQVILPAPSVSGSLDRELVRRVVRRHINEVRFCYERALAARPDLEGRVTAQFTITATGQVVASVIQDSTLDDDADFSDTNSVAHCLTGAIRRWEFPASRTDGITIVSYPFSFRPTGD